MTFREFECALGWEIAGRYNQEIHSALLRPPIAVWEENEASTPLRMPRDRMASGDLEDAQSVERNRTAHSTREKNRRFA